MHWGEGSCLPPVAIHLWMKRSRRALLSMAIQRAARAGEHAPGDAPPPLLLGGDLPSTIVCSLSRGPTPATPVSAVLQAVAALGFVAAMAKQAQRHAAQINYNCLMLEPLLKVP